MAFTAPEKALIRRYLGYPDLWRYKDVRLEGAMDTAGEDPDASALVIQDLAQLAEIDSQILGRGASAAGIKAVDEIEFFEGAATVSGLRSIGRSIAGRISITLGVPFWGDYFGVDGYPGDSFMQGGTGGGRGYRPGGGGNITPLG